MPPGFSDVERRFRAGLAAAMGIDPGRFDGPGTVIAATPDRDGSRIASAYAVGRLTVIWCDPAIAERVASLADATSSFPVDGIEAWAAGNGADFVGGAWSHLIVPESLDDRAPPPGGSVVVLDRGDPAHRALVRALVAECDADDVDAIDLDLEALDRLMIGVRDDPGRLLGLACERPWECREDFGDIAVLVHPAHRREGVGAAAVSRLCREDFDLGRWPLYRCNWDREASRGLARSLGFVEVLSLAAVTFG